MLREEINLINKVEFLNKKKEEIEEELNNCRNSLKRQADPPQIEDIKQTGRLSRSKEFSKLQRFKRECKC